jgi:radical SAM-linked protein
VGIDPVMRIRITFAKTESMRFTSHLDLHRTWERTFRRARLPLAYSHGFNPRPRLNLACALPLGFTGSQEILDAWLEQALSIADIQQALEQAAPPGLRIHGIEIIDEHAPALQTVLEASDYTLTLDEHLPDLDRHLAALIQAESLPRQRRGKDYDLRPLVLELKRLPDGEDGRQRIRARLKAQEGATGRPEEVLEVLGADPLSTQVNRDGLVIADMRLSP